MLAILTVLLISFVTFFRNITAYPLRNWDEAWYAEEIKNMASGAYGYITPFWNGHYYFDKPPLYFWLSLTLFKFFGPGEWQVRIVSATASVFATLLVYLIGKKLFNTKTGLISSLIFLTMGQVVVRFAHGNLDGLLVSLFLASFYFYLLSEKKGGFSVLTGISIGLGFLTKGWFLGLFPALLITLYCQLTTKKLPKNLLIIIPTALISAGWWYVLGTLKFGPSFVNWYILNPGGNLLQSPLRSFSTSYIKDLLRDIGLWFAILLISIASLLSFPRKRESRFSIKSRMTNTDRNIIYAFLITILLFIFPLNFLSDKLGWYNLPTYPLLALIIGYFASRLSPMLITVVLIAQFFNVIRIESIFPDRSVVGADLGIHAKQLIPKADTVILNDHDFTSFLYYSDLKTIYMVQKNGGKPEEWWVLDYHNLQQVTNSHKKTWIITPNPNNLPKDLKNPKVEDIFNGYTFVSLSTDTI